MNAGRGGVKRLLQHLIQRRDNSSMDCPFEGESTEEARSDLGLFTLGAGAAHPLLLERWNDRGFDEVMDDALLVDR